MPQHLPYMPLDTWKSLVESKTPPSEDTILCKGFVDDEIKVKASERRISITLSTKSVDRDNDTIDPSGWDLKHYRKNPVVLFGHRYADLPIAVAVKITKDADRLHAVDQFVDRDIYALADTVYQMMTHDPPILRTSSVGFRSLAHTFNDERRGVDFHKQELLEHSIVPVPSNPDALIEARSVLSPDILSPYIAWCAQMADEWTEEDGVWIPRKDVEAAYIAAGPNKIWSIPTPSVPNTSKQETVEEWIQPPLNEFVPPLPEEPSWEDVKSAMGVLLGLSPGITIPEAKLKETYEYIVSHYQRFNQSPPAFRYVEAQVLKHLSETYMLNNDGRVVLRDTTTHSIDDLNTLFVDVPEDGADHNHPIPTSLETVVDADELRALARATLQESIAEAFRSELTAITGRLD